MQAGIGFICTGLTQSGTTVDGLAQSWYFFAGALVCAVICFALLARTENSLLRNVIVTMFILAGLFAGVMGVVFYRLGAECGAVNAAYGFTEFLA